MIKQKPIVITTGEPAGIGMDIVLDVLVNSDVIKSPVLVCTDKNAFYQRAADLIKVNKITQVPDCHVVSHDEMTGAMVCSDETFFEELNQHKIVLIDIVVAHQVVAGVLDVDNAVMVEQQLSLAHGLAKAGRVLAIVTAPLQKSVMVDAGIMIGGELFSGHTEYFMHQCGCDKVVMMLANRVMKVALVTTHLPLKDVANAITDKAIYQTVDITYRSLVHQFGIKTPKILVCGLNPHAGESGHLGDEEMKIINPVLQSFRDEGINVSLAMPADTLFTKKHLQDCDAVIAMYHDQGLAPLKSHGFGETVNVTLGLPYVRTSVDHGTALDLAGTGQADSSSLRHAIMLAYQMLG